MSREPFPSGLGSDRPGASTPAYRPRDAAEKARLPASIAIDQQVSWYRRRRPPWEAFREVTGGGASGSSRQDSSTWATSGPWSCGTAASTGNWRRSPPGSPRIRSAWLFLGDHWAAQTPWPRTTWHTCRSCGIRPAVREKAEAHPVALGGVRQGTSLRQGPSPRTASSVTATGGPSLAAHREGRSGVGGTSGCGAQAGPTGGSGVG